MNKKMTILGALLMAVAVTGYSVSGTYAKYTDSAVAIEDSARVAKFKVTKATGASFTLFDTKTAAGDAVIAPGYSGSKEFTFTNEVTVDSEVPTTLSYELDSTSKTLTHGSYDPMLYALVEKNDTVTSAADLQDSDYEAFSTLATKVGLMEEGKTYIIAWKWADDGQGTHDADDTTLGNAMADALAATYAADDAKKAAMEPFTVRVVVNATVTQDTTKLNQAN